MTTIGDVLVIGLAAFRVASLLAHESGPFDVFLRLRSLAGVEHTETGEPFSWPETFFGKLLRCPWCLSPWTAALMAALWLAGGIGAVIVAVLAAAAVVVIVAEHVASR